MHRHDKPAALLSRKAQRIGPSFGVPPVWGLLAKNDFVYSCGMDAEMGGVLLLLKAQPFQVCGK